MLFFPCLLSPGGNFSKAIVQQKLRSLEHPHLPGLNQGYSKCIPADSPVPQLDTKKPGPRLERPLN